MKRVAALAALLLLVGSAGAGEVRGAFRLSSASAPSFAAAKSYATGRSPTSVAIGDLNDDGKPDLALTSTDQTSAVSVLLNRPGLYTVQNVRQTPLPAAKRTIARANCRVGRISQVYSRIVRRGRVISQRPRFGAVLPGGGKVTLVVSRGRWPS